MKNINIIFIWFLLFLPIIFSSCTGDTKPNEKVDYDLEFLVDGYSVVTLDGEDQNELINNDSLLYWVSSENTFRLKDKTTPADKVRQREWKVQLVGNEDKEKVTIFKDAIEVEVPPMAVGLYKVELWIDNRIGDATIVNVVESLPFDYTYTEINKDELLADNSDSLDNEIPNDEVVDDGSTDVTEDPEIENHTIPIPTDSIRNPSEVRNGTNPSDLASNGETDGVRSYVPPAPDPIIDPTAPPNPYPNIKVNLSDVKIGSNKLSGIAGDVLSFEDASTNPSIITSAWYVNGRFENKGGTFDHVFMDAGTFEVKLCVNDNMSLCKAITVKISKKTNPIIKVRLSDVKLEAKKLSGKEGESFTFKDVSTNSAIVTRSWYVEGKLLDKRKSLNHIFEKAGKFKVKLCVNDDKTLCREVRVKVSKKSRRKQRTGDEYKEIVGDFFDYTLNGKGEAGFSSTCGSATEVSSGSTQIKPSKPISLKELTVYATNSGFITIQLSYTNAKGKLVTNKSNKPVNAGKSQVGLSDFGVVLLSGSTFTLKIFSSNVKFKDSTFCGSSQKGTGMTMTPTGIIHNLKYYH